MDVLKKYKVFCVTENAFVEVWKLTKPMCCPTNSKHIIDEDLTQQIDQKVIESENVQTMNINSKNYYTTNGNYRCEGRSYVIPQNTTTFVENINIPVPMCVFGMRFCVRDEHCGDTVSFIGQPDTIVGIVTQNVDANASVIHVNDTVCKYTMIGYYVVIGGEERLVTNVDSESYTITVDTPFTNEHLAGSYVALNVYIIRNVSLDTAGIFDVGYGAFGGKFLDKGANLRLIYHKADSNATKTFSFHVEYMY